MRITQIKVPFPSEYGRGRGTNAYLLEGEIKVLVDSGFDSEENRKFIRKALEKTGAWDLDVIVLTHGHLDHFSLGVYLQRETGASLMVHKDDSEMLTDYSTYYSKWFEEICGYAVEGGFDPGILEEARIKLITAASILSRYAPHEEFTEISLAGGSVRTMHLPGHTDGSVGVVTGDAVFAGDAMIEGSTVVRDLKKEFNSLEKLKVFKRVYPGHDRSPLSRAEVETLEAHFVSRLDKVLSVSRGGARLKDVVTSLYGEMMLDHAPYRLILPINQAIAYLKYLETEGHVEKRGGMWYSFVESISSPVG
ncbi:MAG: MBL fold metallo-hydrolase [Candidatus Methanosuratus sp.]|nr:MBL fold metallo-hydrolase [Candidatus Methanosuratincola sp.]